jgi:tetratricopeptide (TPR) repeat protein
MTSLVAVLPLCLAIIGFALCWRFRQRWGRPLLFGLGCFLVTLFPALGFFDSQFLTMWQVSDHLQYLPLIAPVALAIGSLAFISQRAVHHFHVRNTLKRGHQTARLSVRALARLFDTETFVKTKALPCAGAATVLTLALMTFQRARIFSTEEALYRDTLAKNPAASVVHNDLGVRLARSGNYSEATAHFAAAVQSNPSEAGAQLNLAQALAVSGDSAGAEPHFVAAIKLEPANSMARAGYDLAYLFKDYLAFTASAGPSTTYQPLNTLLQVSNGSVIVDVLPVSNVAATRTDLESLGFQETAEAAYLGRLEPEAAMLFKTHSETCPPCRQVYEETVEFVVAISAAAKWLRFGDSALLFRGMSI